MRFRGKPFEPEDAFEATASGDQRATPPPKQLSDSHKSCIPDRIVILIRRQDHPIVRGKSRAACEFGAKISVSVKDGFVFLRGMS
jgi:hypothetical protein